MKYQNRRFCRFVVPLSMCIAGNADTMSASWNTVLAMCTTSSFRLWIQRLHHERLCQNSVNRKRNCSVMTCAGQRSKDFLFASLKVVLFSQVCRVYLSSWCVMYAHLFSRTLINGKVTVQVCRRVWPKITSNLLFESITHKKTEPLTPGRKCRAV